jgi:low temperature requirement protein LtrA
VALPGEPRAGEHVIRAGIPDGLIEAPEELRQRVTPLELFFDLVFVFAMIVGKRE